ncbi:hypothetical protein H2201_007083 [Coniosporium apollinis]|uniref:AB hydrolase-1 domain-containing protein n=2 Tax=Coniosporium TaxID=2810619 RepID=A0ABQ9NP26_9PEZI|nr:hypothetical protein H2199_003976 [Cladosporium sp. JES 115]KAJ9659978.1 hypothetical protein H2201_007083 [Coniosporium apollinis]
MIGTSLWEYIFIRACAIGLHFIAPLSLLYCSIVLFLRAIGIHDYRYPLILEIWLLAETAFFLFVYLPFNYYLQRAATHPELPPREGRRELFRQCHDNVPDPQRYLSKWFLNAPIEEIKRENVKEFLRWAFLNKSEIDAADEEELNEYVEGLEKLVGRRFEKGRGEAKCLRLTLDRVNMLHRSLAWYMCVFVVDTLTYLRMLYHSFHFHRLPFGRILTVFPLRPLTLLSRHRTPARTLTYWHRPHTSKSRLPILFIHGIGIGLYPYVKFLAELNSDDELGVSDGELGIIAVEIMPVSFRITGPALQKEEMCEEVRKILAKHGWEEFVLVSHSYGSVISTHLLHDRDLSRKIQGLVLIDPVSFLLHLPDVAFNFIKRKPMRANEHQLYYFGSKDMGVSHTLSRRFFWSENILWKHDIEDRHVTVSLSGKDLIVDTDSVRQYLTGKNGFSDPGSSLAEDWSNGKWTGNGLNVLWFENLDHAQVFDLAKNRRLLGDIIRGDCACIGR